MNQPRSRLRILTIALVALLVGSGCDLVYFEYSDCRYYNAPRFDRLSLFRPVLNQEYTDQVRILLDDDWHIDSYDYHLEFSGSLPPGITFYDDRRGVVFEGTATSQGVYSFAIIIVARYHIRDRYYYGSHRDYCSYRTVQNYQLTVEPI